jgi:hypothetical protein
VTYARPFFDLQVEFASRVSELAGVSLADALLTHTNLHIRLGFGREFAAAIRVAGVCR